MANPTSSTQSTFTLQYEIDAALCYGDIRPAIIVAGFENRQAIIMANDVMNAICAVSFPHKWNEQNMVPFYQNSLQQDYAIVNADGSSVTNMSWLQRGVAININSGAVPKEFREVEVGRQLPQQTGAVYNGACRNPLCLMNWYPNYMLYFGTWGAGPTGNATFGNNPLAGSVYQAPFSNNGSLPANPITQIRDANGNYLVLTTYGTEGITAPAAPANSPAGTTCSGSGATTVWTVVDPNGTGIRMIPAPSSTGVVWQFNLVYQAKPIKFANPGQTLFPLPDDMEPHFRAGFVAQCYKFSSETKVASQFPKMWQLWLASLNEMRAKEDRETEENVFVPDRGIMGGNRGSSFLRNGPAWPFNYPIS